MRTTAWFDSSHSEVNARKGDPKGERAPDCVNPQVYDER